MAALYIEKSEGNSPLETIFCIGLAALGVVLLLAALWSLFDPFWGPTRKRGSVAAISCLLGSTLLFASFQIIDQDGTDYIPPVTVGEQAVDGNGIAIRIIDVTRSANATRISAQLHNTGKTSQLFNRVGFYAQRDGGPICWHDNEDFKFFVEANLEVSDGVIVNANVGVRTGVLNGTPQPLHGLLWKNACGNHAGISASFHSSIALSPSEVAGISVDIPHVLYVTTVDDDKDTVNIPHPLQIELRDEGGSVTTAALRLSLDGNENSACVARKFGDRQTQNKPWTVLEYCYMAGMR